MNKNEEVQEWFLIKWNWDSWLLTLSDEDAGKVIKALYTGNIPEGLLGTLISSHFDEFKRVNEFRAENQKQRSETNSKNAKSRWDMFKELECERKNKHATAYDRTFNDAAAFNRNANTYNILHITEDILHGTEDSLHVLRNKLVNKGKYNLGMKIPSIFKTEEDYLNFLNQ